MASEQDGEAASSSQRRDEQKKVDPGAPTSDSDVLWVGGDGGSGGDEGGRSGSPVAPSGTDPMIGRKIGRYSIKSVVASGGMGTVYLAVQEEPHRRVALKVMKQGIASRSALARFQFEAQTLARLRHPGICQIYEAGTHYEESVREGGTGVPYFAMEYIPSAHPITEYAESQKLDTTARLKLFASVCEAVAHGHQKGIIHRDLKPSNILVDSTGQVKVIDFGVARATDSDMAVTTVQTDVGQLIGTLQYMSPEQCDADPDDLDIRSDVYSLGVVLYQLLCGQLPYDVSRSTLFEAARVVKEESPTRPSTFNRTLRGDVETITLKALSKDRQRRYPSALNLAEDIRRYLNHEPVEARPPSLSYQISRFAQRHRAAFGALAAIMVVLAAATVVSIMFALSEAEHRRAAEDARGAFEATVDFQAQMLTDIDPLGFGAVLARTLRESVVYGIELSESENEARDLSFVSFEKAMSVVNLTDWASAVLQQSLLEAAATAAREQFSQRPLVLARILGTLAEVQGSIGAYESAEVHARTVKSTFEQTLGASDPQTLAAANNLGYYLKLQGKYDEAEQIYLSVLESRAATRGADHPDTLITLDNLGGLYLDRGDYAKAESYYNRAYEGLSAALGADDPETLTALTNLGSLYTRQAKYTDAERCFREVHDVYQRVSGSDGVDTLMAAGNLGTVLQLQDKLSEAETFLHRSLTGYERALGRDHPDTLLACLNYGALLESLGRPREAEPYYRAALEGFDGTLGPAHRYSMTALNNMGYLYDVLGQAKEAMQCYQESLNRRARFLGESHFDTLVSMHNLASFLQDNDQVDDAHQLYQQYLPAARKTLPADHWILGAILSGYGRTLLAMDEYEKANDHLSEAHGILQAAYGDEHERTIGTIEILIDLYDAWHEAEPDKGYDQKAEEWRAELPVEEKSEEDASGDTPNIDPDVDTDANPGGG